MTTATEPFSGIAGGGISLPERVMAMRWGWTVAFAGVVLVGACSSDDTGRIEPSPHEDAGLEDVIAPDGSVPDGGAPACDDGDPCTSDVAVDGACVHTVAPDGTPCNDGLRCTGDDRCTAGVCRGSELTPHVQARGHFIGFGAAPNEDGHPLNGLGEFVSDERMLFLDSIGPTSSALSLVQITPTGLTRLDTKEIDVSFGWDVDSADHSQRTTSFVVPLGDGRAAVIASQQRIEIFDTTSGKIVSVGRLALDGASETIVAAVGRGGRFYTCERHAVDAWEVGAGGAVLELGRFALPNTSGLPNACSSLALTPDGLELLVASREGIDRADVTDPSAMTLKTRFAPDENLWRVAADGDFVVAQRPLCSGNIPRAILVYRRSALEADPLASPLMRIDSTPRGTLPAKWPLGFAFLDGALAVEWKLQDANGFHYVTEVQALPGGAARTASFTHRSTRDDRTRTRPFLLARRGQYLAVPPWRTVLRHAPALDSFTALGQAAASGFESLVPGAADHVVALSGLGVHDVDLRDPDAPSVSGQPLPRDVTFYRWHPGGTHPLAAPLGLSESEAPKIGALSLRQQLTPVGCFAPASGTIAPSGFVNIADEVDLFNPGRVVDLGRALLHVNAVDGYTSVRLRWYDAPSACDGRTLAPTVDGLVPVHPEHLWFAAGGDASGAPVVVVADVRGIEPESTTVIRWHEREPATSKWRTAASLEVDGVLANAVHVEVHRDLALVHDRRRMLLVRRTGSTLSVVAEREVRDGDELEDISEILRFDEELVFATTTKAPQGVVVLRTRDLQRVGRFTTHGLARSMAETNGKVVFGSANAVDVVDSICPP